MRGFAFEGIKSGSVRPHRARLRGPLPFLWRQAGCGELPGVSQCEGSYQQGRQWKQRRRCSFLITPRLQVLWDRAARQHRGNGMSSSYEELCPNASICKQTTLLGGVDKHTAHRAGKWFFLKWPTVTRPSTMDMELNQSYSSNFD